MAATASPVLSTRIGFWSPPLSTRIGFRPATKNWSPVLSNTVVGPTCARVSLNATHAGPTLHRHSAKVVPGSAQIPQFNGKSPRGGSPSPLSTTTSQKAGGTPMMPAASMVPNSAPSSVTAPATGGVPQRLATSRVVRGGGGQSSMRVRKVVYHCGSSPTVTSRACTPDVRRGALRQGTPSRREVPYALAAETVHPWPSPSGFSVTLSARAVPTVLPVVTAVPSAAVGRADSLDPPRQFPSLEPPPLHSRVLSLEPPVQRVLSLEPPRLRPPRADLLQGSISLEQSYEGSPLASRRHSSPAERLARSHSPSRPSSRSPVCTTQHLNRLHSAPQSPFSGLRSRRVIHNPQLEDSTVALSASASRTSSPLSRTHGSMTFSCALPPPVGLGALMQGMLSRRAAVTALAPPGMTTEDGDTVGQQPEAEPADAVDHAVRAQLRTVDPESLSRLMVKRLSAGKYEVDGRRVTIRWGPSTDKGTSDATALLVREDEVGGDEGSPESSLPAYLQQAANVAAALQGRVPGASAVTRIPQEKRLTFGSPGSGALESLDVLQRCASMRKACEEARIREKAAQAYESGLRWWNVALPNLPPDPEAAEAVTPTRAEHAVKHEAALWH